VHDICALHRASSRVDAWHWQAKSCSKTSIVPGLTTLVSRSDPLPLTVRLTYTITDAPFDLSLGMIWGYVDSSSLIRHSRGREAAKKETRCRSLDYASGNPQRRRSMEGTR
jgi:hypothetical protein